MMNEDEVSNIKILLKKLNEIEISVKDWSSFDESMYMLSLLSDREIVYEIEKLNERSRIKDITCSHTQIPHECNVNSMIEAVKSIMELYYDTGSLHEKNRYIISYFLTAYHNGSIK